MTLVIAPQHEYTSSHTSSTKKIWHLQQLLGNWLMSQSSLRYYWDKNRMFSKGHHVPYRVWSRHSAYLEMQRRSRNYN